MKLKIKKLSLFSLALMSSFTFAGYIVVVNEKYSITEDNSGNQPETPVYDETNNKEVSFPEGHVISSWVGNGYIQSNVNKKIKIYLTNDSAGLHRYGTDWYGGHNSGTYLEDDWTYRGHGGALGNVNHGIFVKSSKNYDNNETQFPVGHILLGWVGNGYIQSNVNKTTKIYLTNDSSGSHRYGSDWYGNHNSGTYLDGDWEYRGHAGALGNVSTGLFVRVN